MRKSIRPAFGNTLVVDCASNAPEARELVSSRSYDVVLMDIELGNGPSGAEIFREFRKMPAYANVPIVAITAYALPGDRERFLEMGFDAYISKPFRQNDILELLMPRLAPA